MKKILILIFAFIATLGVVSGASFFTTYQLNFPSEQPTSIFVSGGECVDNSCSTINSNLIELYNANEVNLCWNQYGNNLAAFDSCVAPARITGNIANLVGTANQIVTKVTTPSNFGYITWFSANGDSYLTMVDRASNYICNFNTCIDTTSVNIDFQKKANGIANVGQLNVKNIDNSNLPVQIEVPVSIDQTVCSAFQFTNPNWYRPVIPTGYSDFSVDTLISLNITKVSDGSNLGVQSLTLPIMADSCAGLGAFSWTPIDLLGEDVKFEITSEIIDNQISSSTRSFANVIENVYPQNLDGTCYVRAFDLTLANTATQVMTPSNTLITTITQLNLTENLFSQYTAGAFRDNAQTPMNFEAIFSIDGNIVSQNILNSGANLQTYTSDLTANIANLNVGSHNVELTVRPVGTACTISKNVVLSQNLEILNAETYSVTFHLVDTLGNPISEGLVNLQLLNLNGNYASTSTYNNSIISGINGTLSFNNILAGEYRYVASKSGLGSTSNIITINSNSDLYVTINNGNVNPTITLPDQLSSYYLNPITFDLRNYVNDFNDAFDTLNFTGEILSGNILPTLNNGIVTITTTQIGVAEFRINVIDPSGEAGYDTILLNFTDVIPSSITSFTATPTNGQSPLNTVFSFNINNPQSNLLSCIIDFGDGTIVSQLSSDCADLNGFSKVYNNTGSYKAILSIDDGSNPINTSSVNIYVYNRSPSPKVNSFTLTSSNGNLLPTNLELNWEVIHTGEWPMTCNLRVNGISSPVDCIGSTSYNNYNISGISKFSIIAIDNASVQVLETREIALGEASNLFDTTSLIMSDIIVPGQDFKFNIRIENEIFDLRDISLRPSIVCNNVVNNYKSSTLDTSLNSNVDVLNNFKDYELTINTNDFKLAVPTDVVCEFRAELFDNYGFYAMKTKNVVFSYPQEAQLMTSIRGKGTDIINFMSSALVQSYGTGYNSIEFTVKNNEEVGKKLSISFTATDLGINYILDENLAFGQERSVQIPLYIEKNTKSGKYPVRISVSDGTDKQTRYSYITIK